MKILLLDNYDSFTYNLLHAVKELGATDVEVVRNDQINLDEVERFDKIILSPGPGIPEEAGLLLPIIKRYAPTKSILGVCLGHQAIGEAFGARLENLKEVYKELFDDSVERYNVGKRKDRQITNYYEKIRQGKQEKLFHEVIFQIGNREDMAVGTAEGDLAVKILDEYVKDFQKRNPTLRVFGCYLHQDESTPHLHIDFIPYVTDWKGKGMDTRVSLKQALKSLGFQGGNKHDTELNQWINHEKEVLAEIARQYGIEWEQKGTHEEHLDVYNFKKKERKKEVQELEQEKEHLTAEKEELTAQIAESRADIQNLKDDKEQASREKQEAEQRAEDAEKEVKSLEERRDVLQPIMDNASKEIKEYGMIKTFLPEAGTFERAVPYRENKIKPLFIKMKNQIAALAGKVVELNKTIESWKNKYQKSTEKCDDIQTQLDDVRKENGKLSNDNQRLQEISDRYDRVVRILGMETVEDVPSKLYVK